MTSMDGTQDRIDRQLAAAGAQGLGSAAMDNIVQQLKHSGRLSHLTRSYIDRIRDEMAKDGYTALIANVVTSSILLQSIQEIIESFRDTPCEDDSLARGGLTPVHLSRVKHFIDSNLHKQFHIAELARAINLSAKHFARAFRQSTGVSPHRWVVQRRIDRACRMLEIGESSLAGIASECGFADQSHMTSAFRKFAGLTPGAYRRRMRSGSALLVKRERDPAAFERFALRDIH